jgi:hypothetical protein
MVVRLRFYNVINLLYTGFFSEQPSDRFFCIPRTWPRLAANGRKDRVEASGWNKSLMLPACAGWRPASSPQDMDIRLGARR